MTVFYYALIGFHVAVAVAMIAVVLLQTGKGAGLSGVFGAGGAATESFFGGRGPGQFLTKLTTAAAIIFMLTCLALARVSTVPLGGKSVMDKAKAAEKAKTPAHRPGRAPLKRPAR